jgi:adenylosuccinate synthase
MPATIIMGGQWGDEGKGKLTDALAGRAQMVVRANGGANAGHTVQTDRGTFKMHLVPSGILNPDCACIVGAGVVLDPISFLKELDQLHEQGISTDRLKISARAHVVLPYHAAFDRVQEDSLEEGKIGTTLRGIGPAYSDKAARLGLRVSDLVEPTVAATRLRQLIDLKNRQLDLLYGAPTIDADAVIETYRDAGERLRPFVAETEPMVYEALHSGRQVLVECAQGAMLDIDYGTYPFVTSSSPSAAGACQGAGIAPTFVERVIAVFKAYGTRVGSGPFPTELHDETGQLIRERGREYGTTTGRPRRTGWFDAVAARHVVRLNGVTEITLTLLDVLDALEEIQVCTSYALGGEKLTLIPASTERLSHAKPTYAAQPGWMKDITDARAASDLPERALAYVREIESLVGAPITMVGVGPAREQLVALSANAAMNAAAAA